MPVTFFTPSEWLAQGAIDYQDGKGYEQAPMVALPGALQAIHVDELDAHHAVGNSTHEITEVINERWRTVAATRIAQTRTWVARIYLPGLEHRRQIAAELAADEMRRRAVIEKLIAERQESDAG